MTANGEVQTREEERENVKQLDLFVKATDFLKKLQQFSLLGNSVRIMGYTYHWTSGQKTTSHRKWQENWQQYFQRCTENPVPETSGSMSEELRGDPLHESTETENKNQKEEREEVQRDISHDLS